ncbi:Protein of unknown function, partial [Gryllus bimaculatus]
AAIFQPRCGRSQESFIFNVFNVIFVSYNLRGFSDGQYLLYMAAIAVHNKRKIALRHLLSSDSTEFYMIPHLRERKKK